MKCAIASIHWRWLLLTIESNICMHGRKVASGNQSSVCVISKKKNWADTSRWLPSPSIWSDRQYIMRARGMLATVWVDRGGFPGLHLLLLHIYQMARAPDSRGATKILNEQIEETGIMNCILTRLSFVHAWNSFCIPKLVLFLRMTEFKWWDCEEGVSIARLTRRLRWVG